MSHSAPEKSIIVKDNDNDKNCTEQQEGQKKMENCVSSHLLIKPSHSNKTLDKEMVLRRIRHRKRMNNVKSALNSFLGSSPKTDYKVSVSGIKWVDDAFAAL